MHLLCAHITTIRQRQRGSFSANFSTWRMESAYGSLGRRYSKASPNSCKSILQNGMLAQLGNHHTAGKSHPTKEGVASVATGTTDAAGTYCVFNLLAISDLKNNLL